MKANSILDVKRELAKVINGYERAAAANPALKADAKVSIRRIEAGMDMLDAVWINVVKGSDLTLIDMMRARHRAEDISMVEVRHV